MPDATVVQTIEAKQAEAFRLLRTAIEARKKATKSGAADDVTAAEAAETKAREAEEAAVESMEMDMPMGGGAMPESDGAMDMSALAEGIGGKFKALGEALEGMREHGFPPGHGGAPPVHDDDGGHGDGDGSHAPAPPHHDASGGGDAGGGDGVGAPPSGDGDGDAGGVNKPPADLNMLIADIKADLAALSDHLDGIGGGGNGDGAGAGMNDGGGGTDAGMDAGMGGEDASGGGRPMRYKCTACGEDNDVLPPKGYTLTRVGESHKLAGGKLKEAYLNAVDKLDKKEERFLEANKKIATLSGLAESEKKRADAAETEVAKYKRRDRAVKMVREAIDPQKGGLSPDMISVQELLQVEESLWPSLIKMKQSTKKVETRLAESIPAGPGGFFAAGAQPTTAKEALAAAQAAQAQK